MARVGHIQKSRAKVHVAKLCMDPKQDRAEYEKIKAEYGTLRCSEEEVEKSSFLK